jgi:aspartate/methionine/tyrosine aminotransferase
MTGHTMQSAYMHFAKFGTGATYNLASSGVANAELADFGLKLDDLALNGVNTSGYRPLMQKVADRFGVSLDSVVMPGGGCSFANHLAFAAMLNPGDEVLVEDPTYELLTSTLGYLRAEIRTFERSPAEAWALDPVRVVAAFTPRTKLVVLTNLHNPSSALTPIADIHAIADAADRIGAWVFVDEVYLELLATAGHAPTAFREGGNIVVTSSLTKAYGVSGLRCGWILAEPALAERMKRLNDLFGVHPPHMAECASMVAFDRLPVLRERAQAILAANRAAYRELLGAHPKLDQIVFDQGTTVFPRLTGGDVGALFARMTTEHDTNFGPGHFFARPDRLRIGLGGDQARSRIAMERLAEALD